MTEEQLRRNAENYIDENTQGVVIDDNIRNFLIDTYVAGAHSIDEEIAQLRQRIDNLVAIAREQSKPWFSAKENKPEAVDQKEFGARKLSKQVLAMYEDGKCHVVRYDYDCQCWRWANSYGQMFEPKMWRYIDIPEGGIK